MPLDTDFFKITSLINPNVKRVVRLREHQARKAMGLTLVEGFREVATAQEAGVDFKEVWGCPQWLGDRRHKKLFQDFDRRKLPVYEVTQEVFAKISFGDRQEGILAVVKSPTLALSQLKLKKDPLVIVIEKVEKPGNLGAILRTADAAGAQAVIVADAATDLYNPNVIRASLGTVFTVPMAQSNNEATLQFLKEKEIRICSTLPRAKDFYTQADLQGALAIVVGSEPEGLSSFWVENADLQVKIPMRGAADSLNVATTASIVIYEALRQRSKITNNQETITKI